MFASAMSALCKFRIKVKISRLHVTWLLSLQAELSDMQFSIGLPYLQKQNSGQCMATFHETKYMRYHILSHRRLTNLLIKYKSW